jgi:hypothetical protein
MAEKFIELVNGEFVENEGLVSSAGAADAGKIPALDSAGKLDSTLMPSGIGADTKSIVASENLAAGNFVNIYNDAGTPKVRKADNSNGRRAHGFVLSAFSSAATATVYLDGSNTAVTGKTPGAVQFLGTGGASVETAPTSGLSQQVGFAVTATDVKFDNRMPVTLA